MQLIGLNVAIFKEGQGIGFAIPVERVSEALGEMVTPETLRSLWFGGAFESTTNGIVVTRIEPDSPAEKPACARAMLSSASIPAR